MGRFRAFFSRSSKHEQTQVTFHEKHNTSPKPEALPGCGVDIASLSVAGIQRSNQAGYIVSHTAANTGSRPHSDVSSASETTASSQTAVDTTFVSKHGGSHWQGKAYGKQYDKREELSSEDEDMWAKMAM